MAGTGTAGPVNDNHQWRFAMFKFNEPAARAVTMAALLGAILYAAPGLAATADATGASGRMLLAQSTTQGTQVQPAPGTQAPSKKPMRQRPSMEQRVDSWIKSLHTRLKITPEQENQWGQVTQIMRDNAKSMDDLLKQRAQNIKTMSAVDDL